MSTRSVVILLVLALSLAAMVLLFEREVGREVEAGPDEYKVFKAYTEDQVKWVNLVRGDLTVQLERQGDGWQMKSPVRAAAQRARVEKLLVQLGELMEVAEPIKGVQGEKIKLEEYGLSNPWGKIIVSYGGVEAGLSFGQRTKSQNQLYARLGEENRVIVIDAQITKLLDEVTADANFYRSRRIFQDRHINKTLGIELLLSQRAGEKSIMLGKDQGSGRWLLGPPVTDRADGQVVSKLLEDCAALRVVEFMEMPKDPQVLGHLGLTNQGEAGAVAIEAEGMQVVVHLGRADEQGKFRYALVENTAMLAKSQELVKIPAAFVDVLPRSIEALRDRKFLSFENQAANEVQIRGPEGEITLGREKSRQWVVREPVETAADNNIVARFMAELQGLRARNFVGPAKPEMGFDNPYLQIKVSSGENGGGEILQIGALAANGQARYARLSRDRVVRRIDASKAEELVHDSLYFYERKLAEVGLGEVSRFEIKTAGTQKSEVGAVNKEGQWWLAEPVAMRTDNDVVRDVLSIFSPLRAERIVADGVAEDDAAVLGQYGLDEPSYELTVVGKKQSEETTQEHVLLIGSVVADEQDGEYYARLRGREVVFRVSKTVVDKLGGDLRSKKVLGLTEQQMAGLNKVEIIREGERLTLEKLRDNWQVVSPQEFWPSQEAVNGLLQSIVTLSGEGFGAEADKKQYGFDEPTMTVSVGLSEGSYRFLVGKLLEGKGYAVKTEGENIVRLVGAKKLETLGQSYLAYRKKEMRSLKKDKIRAIELVYGEGKRERVQLEQLGWDLKVPAEGALELAKLDGILELMSELRAKELVTDTFEQDKKFGLDKLALTVIVEAVDEADKKVVYTLLIGAEVGDESGSHYARLDGEATVFVLSGADAQVLRAGLVFTKD